MGQSHCPSLISCKGPSSINLRAKSFYSLLYQPHEKRLFQKRLWAGWLSVLKENKEGLCHIRVNWGREDVAGRFWLCIDNAVLLHLTESVWLGRRNISQTDLYISVWSNFSFNLTKTNPSVASVCRFHKLCSQCGKKTVTLNYTILGFWARFYFLNSIFIHFPMQKSEKDLDLLYLQCNIANILFDILYIYIYDAIITSGLINTFIFQCVVLLHNSNKNRKKWNNIFAGTTIYLYLPM